MQSIPSYILAYVWLVSMYCNDKRLKRAHRLVVGSLALATFSQFAVNSQEPLPLNRVSRDFLRQVFLCLRPPPLPRFLFLWHQKKANFYVDFESVKNLKSLPPNKVIYLCSLPTSILIVFLRRRIQYFLAL